MEGGAELLAKGSGTREKIVYIWDMDETIILLKSLLNGSYAGGFNGSKDVQQGIELGKMWEKHILQVCDDYFFYEQVENYNSPSLDALSEYDDGRELGDYDFRNDNLGPPSDDVNKRKLAYRYRMISKTYQQGLRNNVDQDMVREWNELYELTDKYTDGWLSSARSFLEQCSGQNKESGTEARHTNILVTSGSLIPSLVKCVLFQLDDLFAHNNGLCS
uniref:protein-tyrosine-phosphatase n=1 Tax=Kalanchoe fedtschenkoi TaxID=63787 RepID=A0A7N0UZR4_KALFE